MLGGIAFEHHLRRLVLELPRSGLGDAEAAAVSAIAGPQFSVVSGGVLCLVGLAAVLRLFPQLLGYEVGRTDRVPTATGSSFTGAPPE